MFLLNKIIENLNESSLDDRFNDTIDKWISSYGYEMFKQQDGITALINRTKNEKGPVGIIFKGKSTKPLSHYIYSSEQQFSDFVDKAISNNIDRMNVDKERREKRKLTSNHDIKVGDIFYTYWGYDQTNSEFYQVVNVRGSRIDLKEIASKVKDNSYGRDTIYPIPDNFVNDKIYTVSARADGTVTNLEGKDFLHLSKYKGGTVEVTDAYSGH